MHMYVSMHVHMCTCVGVQAGGTYVCSQCVHMDLCAHTHVCVYYEGVHACVHMFVRAYLQCVH